MQFHALLSQKKKKGKGKKERAALGGAGETREEVINLSISR